MKYICSCGRISKIKYSNFYSGNRCNDCGNKTIGKKLSKPKQYYKNEIKKMGYLLADDFKHWTDKLKFICPKCNDTFFRSYSNLNKTKNMCKPCSWLDISNENNYRYRKDRDKMHQEYKFHCRCNKMLLRCLKLQNQKKIERTHKMLGFSPKELMKHILNHNNWKNNKWDILSSDWHIDHIFPFKAFMEYNINDIKTINCLENLQPLSKKENLSKHDKYNKEEFESWLRSKNIKFKSKLKD